LIEKILQQATTTVTATGSQLDFKTEALFWFTLFGSAVGLALGVIRLWEWRASRSAKRVRPLDYTLRIMRSSLQKDGRTRKVLDMYSEEVESKGYESNLRKVGKLPELFKQLKSRVKEIQNHAYEQSNPWFILKEAFQSGLDQMISADDKVRQIVEQVTIEIDKVLQKAESA
jgi:hypothetical protein